MPTPTEPVADGKEHSSSPPPLSAQIDERQDEHDILFGVINRFIGYFTRKTVPRSTNDADREYPFVAMDTRQAYGQIRLAWSYLEIQNGWQKAPGFLDIGCGIGNILLLAEMVGFCVHGIEKDEPSLAIARELVDSHCIEACDIWHYGGIGDFDAVYYFRPFCTAAHQQRFERKVEDEMKVGAVLIANRKMDTTIDRDHRFHRLDPDLPVWCKTHQK
jgi:SAM-dependent methyltransferase